MDRGFSPGFLSVLFLLAGCQLRPPAPPEPPAPAETASEHPESEPWRSVILEEDAARIDGMKQAWSEALQGARRFTSRIRAAGAVLDPEAALPRPELPPGSYRCRLFRFGSGRQAFVPYDWFFCHVGADGDELAFTKQTGSERPGGYLWPDSANRMVFIGALALNNDQRPPAYGEVAERNVVGVVERVGPFHYRMVFPSTAQGSRLDVLELVPIVDQVD